eukprot:TRINITY_DN15302_c0_g1_i1.p1 TRINITY_DN15302_c0_g1~~TRINITY_DN15302_c0_g1_i1.p1  ORF type:complete len:525 (+),score=98.75 TRINITY_DN15302_c0_g1_i1:54-1628(+)
MRKILSTRHRNLFIVVALVLLGFFFWNILITDGRAKKQKQGSGSAKRLHSMAVGIKELAEDVAKLSKKEQEQVSKGNKKHKDVESDSSEDDHPSKHTPEPAADMTEGDSFVADSDGGFAVSLESALAVHKKKSSAEVAESCEHTKDFQSSKLFHDFIAPQKGGWVIPEVEAEKDENGICDPYNFNPTAEEKEQCVKYLSNKANWKYLRPMNSVLSEARTIKFMIQYNDPEVKAIIKMPQYKFIVEPYSELASYVADNLLGMHRVPATAWVPIQLSWFRASMSVIMPDVYVQWVECFIFKRKELKDSIKKWPATPGEQSLHVSIQLWMKGVKELSKTSVKLSHKVLDKLFDPRNPYEASSSMEKWAITETSELQIFDHIIGNNDRTLHKNAFAVGKCGQSRWICSGKDTSNYPRMVFLDQGSSFYSSGSKPTRVSVFGSDSKVCQLRRKTHKAIISLQGTVFTEKAKELIPAKGFWDHWQTWQLEGGQSRLNSLVSHFEKCRKEFGEAIYLKEVEDSDSEASGES